MLLSVACILPVSSLSRTFAFPSPSTKPVKCFSLKHTLPTFTTSVRRRIRCNVFSHHLDAKAEKEKLARFVEASKKGNLVPLQRAIFADHLTPVLAYRCLVQEDDREAPSFLFESVEQGSKGTNMGRYSVVGAQPMVEIVAKDNSVSIMDHEEGKLTEEMVDDPMSIPRRIMDNWNPQLIEDLPDAFCGRYAVV